MCLLCAAHHLGGRHDGFLRILGTHSTGFRFFRRDGVELTGESRSPVAPTAMTPSTSSRTARSASPLPVAVAPAATSAAVVDAQAALVTLGCSSREATDLLARALAGRPDLVEAGALVGEALRLLPLPASTRRLL
jgi:hypothetical protein